MDDIRLLLTDAGLPLHHIAGLCDVAGNKAKLISLIALISNGPHTFCEIFNEITPLGSDGLLMPLLPQGWHQIIHFGNPIRNMASQQNNSPFLEHNISFRLDTEQLALLDKIAQQEGVNQATLVRIALKRLIESQRPLVA